MIDTEFKIIKYFGEDYLRQFESLIDQLSSNDINFIISQWDGLSTMTRLRISLCIYLVCIKNEQLSKEKQLEKFVPKMSKDSDNLVKIICNCIKNYMKHKDVKLSDFSDKISINSIIVYLTNQVDKLPVQEDKIHKKFLEVRLMDDVIFKQDTINKALARRQSIPSTKGSKIKAGPLCSKPKHSREAAPNIKQWSPKKDQVNIDFINSLYDQQSLFGSGISKNEPVNETSHTSVPISGAEIDELMDARKNNDLKKAPLSKLEQAKKLVDIDLTQITEMFVARLKEESKDLATFRLKPTRQEIYELVKQSSIFKDTNALSSQDQDIIINFVLNRNENIESCPEFLEILMNERDFFSNQHKTSFTEKIFFYGCKSTKQWEIKARYV